MVLEPRFARLLGSPRAAGIAAALVLGALAVVEVDVVRSLSITFDEQGHIGAGFSYVTHGDVVLNPEHPPLVKLIAGATIAALGVKEGSAGPLLALAREQPAEASGASFAYGERLLFHDNPGFVLAGARPGADSIVTAARLPLVVFPVLLALVAYAWARARFGRGGGLLALALVVSYPDVLGPGRSLRPRADGHAPRRRRPRVPRRRRPRGADPVRLVPRPRALLRLPARAREHLRQRLVELPRALPRPLRAEVLVLLPRRRGAQGAARDARPPARRARGERRGAPRPRGRPDRALPPRPGPRSVRRHLDARGAGREPLRDPSNRIPPRVGGSARSVGGRLRRALDGDRARARRQPRPRGARASVPRELGQRARRRARVVLPAPRRLEPGLGPGSEGARPLAARARRAADHAPLLPPGRRSRPPRRLRRGG